MTIPCPVSGYVRYVDGERLLRVAKAERFTVHVLRRVGHFAPAGVPLMTVSKEDRLSPEIVEELCQAFDFGPTRTLQQDVEYGILQIVDIALKAISPAVNDPSTAIGCVDQLSRILICFAARDMPSAGLYDPPGVLRVYIPGLGLERLMESAFEQIRSYSRNDVAVTLRLLRALRDIGSTIPDTRVRRMLADRGQLIVDGVAENFNEAEMVEMRSRLAGLEEAAVAVTEYRGIVLG